MAKPLYAALQSAGFDALDLDQVAAGRRLREFLDTLPKDGSYVAEGVGSRMNAFDAIKFTFPMLPRYEAVVFYMEMEGVEEPHEAIYAVTLWPPTDADDRYSPQPPPHERHPAYITLGGTYQSQDGEFRSPLIPQAVFETQYKALVDLEERLPAEQRRMAQLEAEVMRLVRDSDLVLRCAAFGEDSAALIRRCDDLRLLVRLFTTQCLLFGKQQHAPHLNTMYRKAMDALANGFTDSNLIKKPTQYNTEEATTRVRAIIFRLLAGQNASVLQVGCGMKTFPLMRAELVQLGNVRYPGWRELWFAEKASDLVVNGRTKSLPLFGQTTMFAGAEAPFYDNPALARLFNTSALVDEVLGTLEDQRQLVAEAEPGKYVGARLADLDHQLFRAAEHAETMVVSPVALAMVMQHCGVTLGTAPHLNLSAAFSGAALESVLFDYAYGAYVLHAFGVHADLHYHNLTLRQDWHRRASTPAKVCTAFVLENDPAMLFVVPTHGITGCLIDFSRGLINPQLRHELEEDMGVEQTEAFFREQASRALQSLARWLPAYAERYQRELKGAALARPQETYAALAALDYYAIGRNVGALLDETREGSASWSVDPGVRARCAALETVAYDELIRGLSRLLAAVGGDEAPRMSLPAAAGAKKAPKSPRGSPEPESFRGTPKTPESEDSPRSGTALRDPQAAGRRILCRAFEPWRFERWDPAELEEYVLVDAFNADAPLRYSGQYYDKFPPWTKPEFFRKYTQKKDVHPWGERDAEVSFREDRHYRDDPEIALAVERELGASVTRKPPPNPGGSWLD